MRLLASYTSLSTMLLPASLPPPPLLQPTYSRCVRIRPIAAFDLSPVLVTTLPNACPPSLASPSWSSEPTAGLDQSRYNWSPTCAFLKRLTRLDHSPLRPAELPCCLPSKGEVQKARIWSIGHYHHPNPFDLLRRPTHPLLSSNN